jgi:hypothetical protein
MLIYNMRMKKCWLDFSHGSLHLAIILGFEKRRLFELGLTIGPD